MFSLPYCFEEEENPIHCGREEKKGRDLNSLFLENRSYVITSPAVLLPLTACEAINWLYWRSSRSLVHNNFAPFKICENTWLGREDKPRLLP